MTTLSIFLWQNMKKIFSNFLIPFLSRVIILLIWKPVCLSFEVGCHILWCTNNIQNGCRTQHMPMADGTKCGIGKVSTVNMMEI